MTKNITTDKITISMHSGRTNAPPPLDKGEMDVTATRYWCLVEKDWYRWGGRNSVLLSEEIAEADAFTAAEWIQAVGKDLELWTSEKEAIA